ncbi:MAG: CusA/CzcA family heavy metal efflux RND transporter [Williamsia sp.]|nr:CusA/CzcA family heavy metal efflux RND transporter [Williamsia sp.]
MLNRIIAFSIYNKLIVGIMVLALIAWGIYNTARLPIDAVPDITNNQVLVITSSPSLGASDIERLITFPIETATRNIPGIIEQRSFSRFGLSIITIVFNDRTDVYWARQQVSERLLQVQSQIPAGLGTPSLGPVTTGLGEIFQYVLKPQKGYEGKYTAMELRTIQDWIVRRQLLGTPGIADVSSFGGQLKQYEIGVNPDQLKSYGLTISDVFSALEKNSQNTGGAYIEKGPVVLYIRSSGLVKTREDIEGIVVKTLPDGTPVLIRNIGNVQYGTATRYGAMCYNDQGEVAGAVVMMLKGENSSKVIEAVKEKIGEIRKTLPAGVEIEAFLDRTKMVNNAISTVKRNLLEGALIVVFILILFLGNLRAGLLVASVIPLAMLFAISMMNLFGVSGNLMSLGALDFGLIVDGAVIIVEAVMHHLHQNSLFKDRDRLTGEQMNEEVRSSTSKLMNAAVFGQAIIVIVYLPILLLQGIEGKMFRPMAQTVVFAILGAFLLSLTYVPMMSSLVLSKKKISKPGFADRIMARLEKGYLRVLGKALSYPRTVILSAGGLFAVALVVILNMGGEFIPTLEEGDFAVDTRVLTGSSLTTTIKATRQAAHILLTRFPEVQKVVTKIGSGEIPTDPMTMDASDMMVILHPKKQWTSAGSFQELAEKMSHALEDVPGITTGFEFPVQMRFNELMTGGRQDVICKIFGEDLDTLASYASRIGAIAGRIAGAKDLYVEAQTGLPQIEVNYNRAALSQYGISVSEVNNTLQAAFAGAVSGQVFENEKRFDLVVRLNNQNRQNLADVQNLLIPTSKGAQIPLQQVADVAIKVGPNQIQRENAERRITVGFNVRGKDVQTVVNSLQKKIASQVRLPPGYYITYGGQFENLIEAKKRLSIAVPVSLLLIFLLLYFAFSSFSEGFLIFSAIPLSAIGGVLSLSLRGMPFSISAGVGFIALFGIAVLNGIVLLSEFNQLEKNGVSDVPERIRRGTSTRLRPVLMTAAVASLGFLPMAMSNGAGAEVQRPLATVVIGGLLTATLLTLVVLPALYLVLHKLLAKKIFTQGAFKFLGSKSKSLILFATLITAGSIKPAYTQERRISLEEALQTGLRGNLSVQAARLQTRSLQTLEKSAFDIPFTIVQAEYGQINTIANDTRFTVTQTSSFPVVYKRQHAVLAAQTGSGVLNEQVIRLNVKKQIVDLYYEMLLMLQKKSLLQKADSLFAAFALRQEQRFNTGESNIVEKTAADAQRGQIADQLQQLEADLHIVQSQFAYLLNSRERYLPTPVPLKMALISLPDTGAVTSYPVIQAKKQQQKILRQEIQLYKARKLPLVNIGYNNQSLIGFQNVNGNNKYFGASSRFSSVIAGISIPLFYTAANARIYAGRLQLSAVETEYADTVSRHQALLRQLVLRYGSNGRTLAYFENTALKQAALLSENATLQFGNGAISFLEWTLIINQSIGLQAEYINALAEWNKTVSELNTYTPNY